MEYPSRSYNISLLYPLSIYSISSTTSGPKSIFQNSGKPQSSFLSLNLIKAFLISTVTGQFHFSIKWARFSKTWFNTRLIWYLETQNLLSLYQFGFRTNRSTIDPLTTIHTNICCDSLENINYLLMVSLDIKTQHGNIEFYSRYKNGTIVAT